MNHETEYGWIIKRDLLDNGACVGKIGPGSVAPEVIAKLKKGGGVCWRCLDDDGEVYYSGRFVGDANSEDGFAPLDNFAGPVAGCVTIQYWKNGWKTL